MAMFLAGEAAGSEAAPEAVADAQIKELDKAVAAGLQLNATVDLGPYTGYQACGPTPVYLALLPDVGVGADAKVLRRMLHHGADPTLRCTVFTDPYKHLLSVTPLTHVIGRMVMMNNWADTKNIDIDSAARALLDAGADVNACVEIVNGVSINGDPVLTPYDGAPYHLTAVMLLATQLKDFSGCGPPSTLPRARDMLKVLLERGADLSIRNGEGKTVREMRMSREAEEIIG
jgi:hypothetical protein